MVGYNNEQTTNSSILTCCFYALIVFNILTYSLLVSEGHPFSRRAHEVKTSSVLSQKRGIMVPILSHTLYLAQVCFDIQGLSGKGGRYNLIVIFVQKQVTMLIHSSQVETISLRRFRGAEALWMWGRSIWILSLVRLRRPSFLFLSIFLTTDTTSLGSTFMLTFGEPGYLPSSVLFEVQPCHARPSLAEDT